MNDQISSDPKAILNDLKRKMAEDFPEIADVTYEVKYVEKALEELFKPGFLSDRTARQPQPECHLHKYRKSVTVDWISIRHLHTKVILAICTRRFSRTTPVSALSAV